MFNKRQKNSSVAEEMICSISLELPVDPVTAEDGHVYEREAIEQYFEGQTGTHVKSPLTREIMGKKLLPSPLVRNMTEILIKEKVITGALANNWMDNIKHKEEEEAWILRAEQGDTDTMLYLGLSYYDGSDGFKKDWKKAFTWLKRSHDAGNIEATAHLGEMFLKGVVVEEDRMKGMVYLGKASSSSNYAAYCLGVAFADGECGLNVDREEARHFLELVVNEKCAHQHLSEKDKDDALRRLEGLQNPGSRPFS